MMQTSTETGTAKASRIGSDAKRMKFRDMARKALDLFEDERGNAVQKAIDHLTRTILGDPERYADIIEDLVQKGISSEVNSVVSSNSNLKRKREELESQTPAPTAAPAASAPMASINTRPAHGGSQSASASALLKDATMRLLDLRIGRGRKRLGDMVWSDLDRLAGWNEKASATTAANARFVRGIQAGLNGDREASVDSRFTDATLSVLLVETGASVTDLEKNGDAADD